MHQIKLLPEEIKGMMNFMINIQRIASGNVNYYIVSEHDKAILIDTGRKKYREKILSLLKMR